MSTLQVRDLLRSHLAKGPRETLECQQSFREELKNRVAMSLGFNYEILDGLPSVTTVDIGGPADKAGIKPGDKILEEISSHSSNPPLCACSSLALTLASLF